MVDAVAHGLHLSAGATFAQSWQDRLGVDRHLLAPGELYPVPDPPWPPTSGAARRTPAARSVGIDDRDHPLARVHRGGEIAVAFDFSLSRPLQDLAQGLLRAGSDRVAAALPNGALAELGWDEPRPVAFPVAPRDIEEQAARVLGLVREAQDRDARIVVLPELSTTPEIADAVAQLLAADDVRMLHRKITEGSHEFPKDPTRRFREGIDPPDPPLLTIYVAGPWRFALVICKDFLDPAVRDALQRAGANVILVPSMSEITQPFEAAAHGHVAASQALCVCANGPDSGSRGVPSRARSWPGPTRRTR